MVRLYAESLYLFRGMGGGVDLAYGTNENNIKRLSHCSLSIGFVGNFLIRLVGNKIRH
jgi:hypothetical protein